MSPLLLLLIGCDGTSSRYGAYMDTGGYWRIPELLTVSASCSSDYQFVVNAGTIGWAESGVVQAWEVGKDPAEEDPYAEFPLRSTDFSADETCDSVAIELEDEGVLPLPCHAPFAENYTALIRVTYEKGCAGQQWIGADAERFVEEATIVGDPTAVDADCPAPFSADGWEEDAPLVGTVVDTVPECPATP